MTQQEAKLLLVEESLRMLAIGSAWYDRALTASMIGDKSSFRVSEMAHGMCWAVNEHLRARFAALSLPGDGETG